MNRNQIKPKPSRDSQDPKHKKCHGVKQEEKRTRNDFTYITTYSQSLCKYEMELAFKMSKRAIHLSFSRTSETFNLKVLGIISYYLDNSIEAFKHKTTQQDMLNAQFLS